MEREGGRDPCAPEHWRPKQLKQEWKRGEWILGAEPDPRWRIIQRNRFVVEITFDRIKSEETRTAVNALDSNFSLATEDVDGLRDVGRKLLDESDEWCRFLHRVDSEHPSN